MEKDAIVSQTPQKCGRVGVVVQLVAGARNAMMKASGLCTISPLAAKYLWL